MQPKKGLKGMLLYLTILVLVVVFLAGAVFVAAWLRQKSSRQNVFLPILLYHDINPDLLKKSDYRILPSQLEQDIADMTSQGWTPVSLSAVMDYVKTGSRLPPQPVLLVFDDGYQSFLTWALPVLKEYQAPAVLSIIGEYAQQAEQTPAGIPAEYMSWSDLRKVMQTGLVELQSHSASLHQYGQRVGLEKLFGESAEKYTQLLVTDIYRQQTLFADQRLVLQPSFAYPYGVYNPLAEAVLRQHGVKVTMTSTEQVNLITRSKESLYQLGRLNRSAYLTSEEVLCWMSQAL